MSLMGDFPFVSTFA